MSLNKLNSLVLSVCLLFGPVLYSQNWNSIGSPGLGEISFPTNDTGFGIISGNLIKKTLDGGSSWNAINFSSNCSLNHICFLSSFTGYVTGDSSFYPHSTSSIFKTSDGGNSWSKIFSLTTKIMFKPTLVGQNVILLPATNYSNDTIFLYRSSDAGNTWGLMRVDHVNSLKEAMNFYLSEIGYYFIDNSMYSSIDSGLTWTLRFSGFSITNGFREIHMPSPDTIYAQGPTDMYVSEDSGVTWIQRTTPSSPSNDGYFINGRHGFICTGSSFSPADIWVTNDGAQTWTVAFSNSSSGIFDMDFPSDTVGYAICENNLLVKYMWSSLGVIETLSTFNFTLFPNPAKESITLKDVPLHSQIKMLDANGKLLLSEKAEATEVVLDTHAYASGIYFVEVSDGKNVTRKKVMLQ